MGLMDRLLRGQGWVLLIGALLAGIVYLNVTLLEVNRGIASMSTQAAQLNRENSALRDEIAKKGTSEEIQKLAVGSGFVLPQPKDVVYLKADPVNDARLAAQVAAGAPTAPALDAPPEQADAAPADPQEPVAAVPQAPDTEGPG
jgi:hypothetical protein